MNANRFLKVLAASCIIVGFLAIIAVLFGLAVFQQQGARIHWSVSSPYHAILMISFGVLLIIAGINYCDAPGLATARILSAVVCVSLIPFLHAAASKAAQAYSIDTVVILLSSGLGWLIFSCALGKYANRVHSEKAITAPPSSC